MSIGQCVVCLTLFIGGAISTLAQTPPASLTPDSVIGSSAAAGDVVLDGSQSPFGVFLRANGSTTHSIGAQLGSSSGYFSVSDAGNTPLWTVFAGGYAELRRDQDGWVTAMHLNNGNAGSSSSAASTALRFWQGSALKASFAFTNSGSTSLWGGPDALRITNFASGPLILSANQSNILLYPQATTHFLPVQFRDATAAGYPLGTELKMDGNSFITVSNLQLGVAAVPVIQSLGAAGTSPLRLNWTSDNDVIVGTAGSNKGLRVESVGPSSVAGSLSVGGAMTVNGDMSVNGLILAKYQDVAEWVPAMTPLPAGMVVVLDGTRSNHVIASSRSYDTTVAGVVSARPGIALGEAGDSKALVATTGRVLVRVDASANPIAIGDLLVTSDKPGVAMKSVPIDVQGVKMHRPGTVIGKALEPLESGEGEILVLLGLQ